MTIRPQIVQPQPTAVVTAEMGTKGHRGVHGAGAAVRFGYGIRPSRRRWRGGRGLWLTQGTMRFVGQPLKGLRLMGSGRLRFDGLRISGCIWSGHRMLGLSEV